MYNGTGIYKQYSIIIEHAEFDIIEEEESTMGKAIMPFISALYILCTQIEARVIMARLLQKFDFSLPEDYKVELVASTTLQPKGPVPCTVSCRS